METPCPQCGTQLPPGARFCFNCGHEIEAGATTGEQGKPAQQVADEIAADIGRISSATGERRTITMMFCDVQGSTAAAEQLDPEAWSDVMRGAFDRFIAPVERYEGTVARLLGDAILAYFGAPIAHEDDPERAVLAALEILDASSDYAASVQLEHGVDFGVRIGINTGLVVVGDVGSDLYSEYAALGDAANVAARMEHTAEPGTIRIAEATARLVAPIFDIEEVGEVDVKGKAEPISAFRVAGKKTERGRQRGIEGLHSPVVGRDREVETLNAALAELQRGTGSIVSIMGEAGLGKSRLAAELRNVAGDDVRWLEGQSFSYDASIPYGPFLELLERCFELADVAEEDRYSIIKRKVFELLGGEAADHAVYLAVVLGVDPQGDDQGLVRFIEPPLLRARTFEAIATYIAGLAVARPTVLVLEDLHWADPTSVELVTALLAVADQTPLLLTLLFRPRRDEPSWQIHEAAAREFPHRYLPLELAPLNSEDARELVANLLKVEGLSPNTRELILTKAEGNPFYVEEVIRALLDSGVVVQEGDRFVATSHIDDLEVPDTLVAVLTTRLDRLEPESRRVLQTAAVVGREFRRDTLEAVTDPGIDLDSILAELQRRELILHGADRDSYVFKHALTRDTAYRALLVTVRRDLHGIVGKLVEEREPDRVADLAYHFTEAGEPSRALPYLVAAGDIELAAFSMAEAARHYEAALSAHGDGDDIALAAKAYEGLGQAKSYMGDVAGALETFGEMLAFGEQEEHAPTQVSALNKMAMTNAMMVGDLEEAESLLLRSREIGEAAADQAGIAEFHVVYCVVNTNQGKLETAATHLADAADLGFELDSSYHRNFGLTHHANTLLFLGRYDEAGEAAAAARKQAEIDGDRLHLASLAGGVEALLWARKGDVRAGLDVATWATEELAEIGAVYEEPYAGFDAGFLATLLGRYEEALGRMQRVLALGEMFGHPGARGAGMAGVANIRRAVFGGGDAEAAELAAGARREFAKPMGLAFASIGLTYMAAQALEDGNIDEAAECLLQGSGLQSATAVLSEPEALICSAGVALAKGDLDEAARLLEDARRHIAEKQVVFIEPRLAYASGMLLAARGEVDDAMSEMDEGARLAAEMGLLPDVVAIRSRACSLLAIGGRTEEADAYREEAADAVAEIASLFDDPDLRRAYLRTNTVVG